MQRPAMRWLGLLAALAGAVAWAQDAGVPPEPAPPPVEAVREPTPALNPARDSPDSRESRDPREARDPRSRPAAELKRVEISGQANSTTERRQSTAAKIVVGREEIEQFGDSTLGDVLKRLPSVTIGGRPGRGGAIRMRGMGGGYTQILLDGERVPPGFSIDQIAPGQIERIEIYRAPSAETGARAIAGTINIVLREPIQQRGDDLRLALAVEQGRAQPQLSWTRNDQLGETGTWTLSLSASQTDQHTDTRSLQTTTEPPGGAPVLQQDIASLQEDRRNSLNLNGRLQWRFDEGAQLSLQPVLVINEGRRQGSGSLVQRLGSTPPPYASSSSEGSNHSATGRLAAQWRQRLGDARLELRGSIGAFESDSQSRVNQFDAAGLAGLDQRSATTVSDRSWTLVGKLSKGLGEQHSLVGGWEIEQLRRTESQSTRINGVEALADFGADVQASTRRLAVYLQDDWDLSPAWALQAGLRWEGIDTRSRSATTPVDNRSQVLTPLVHAVWRYGSPRRDQWRASLTRSYRAPTLQNLIALPSLSTLYPVPGANTAANPDRAGNPDLLPEIARGIDLAHEHYLGAGGIVSFSVFRRDIAQFIRNVSREETVPWAPVPRWVSRPRNLGDAVSQGVEFDAKFRLEDLWAGAPGLSLRSNLAWYRSRVAGVPGPDNRIDQQPRVAGNLGGDYRWRGLPLTIGANLNWVPPYAVQQTELQRQGYELRRVVDAYALWVFSPTSRLRLSLANLSPRNYSTTSSIIDGNQQQTVVARGPTRAVASLRFELRL